MAKQKKRIILTGAQCTGKTTLMKALTEDGTKQLSIARDFAVETGWTPEKGNTDDYQKNLFKTLYKALSSKKGYVSDRGLTCVAAYTFAGALDGTIKKKTADDQYLKLQKFHTDNPDILVVYLPIEFAIEADGVRDVNSENQAKMDFLIKNILDTAKVNYITVTGSVEERLKQIEDALK